jgi:lysophospholipase L1-like esterase
LFIVVDITAAFNEDCDGIRRVGDGVHPDEQGHVLIAQAVFETIVQIIEANMSY